MKSISPTDPNITEAFRSAFYIALQGLARDPVVVGFKSIVCYRTGLDIGLNSDDLSSVERGIVDAISSWKTKGSDTLRLANKALNDFVVRIALSIATEFNKPGKYRSHTLTCTSEELASSTIPHWSWRSRSHSFAVLSSPHATDH